MRSKLIILTMMLFGWFNLLSQDWQQLNDTPFFKHHSNGFGFEGKAYVIEGTAGSTDPDGVSNEVWQYTPETDEWTRLNDFPGPGRAIAIGDDMDGKYYYGFGSGINGRLSDLWVYDPLADSFSELPSCPCEGRSHPALVAYKNKIFMGSGSGQQNDLRDWWILDLETMEWSQKENIPGARRHHPFQFAIGDAIYVGGGHISNWSRWDIETETWSQIDDLPAGRVAGSQFSYNGKGYLLSGDDANHGPLEEEEYFMEYDSEADIWTSLPPHPQTNRWAPSSFIIDGYVYLFGGYPYYEEFVRDSSMYKFDLEQLGCLAPNSLNAVNVTDEEAGLFWFSSNDSEVDTLFWRLVGDTDWNVVADAQAVFGLENLMACQAYEYRVVSKCDGLSSLYSEIYQFTTDGCCTTPELNVEEAESSFTVNWEGILAADKYELRWKAVDDQDWMTVEVTNTEFSVAETIECTEYEFQIKPICAIEDVDYSESTFYLSKGCGVCIDNEYCTVEFDDSDLLFIDQVSVGSYQNITGNNGGFGSYIMPDGIELKLGENYDLSVDLGSDDGFVFGSIGAWIDYDGNGEFTNDEQIAIDQFSGGSLNTSITVPQSASLGLTRLRILCTWDDEFEACFKPDFGVGEMEDYCVQIVSSSSALSIDGNQNITIQPNPITSAFNVQFSEPTKAQYNIEIIDSKGSIILQDQLREGQIQRLLNAESLGMKSGIYYCRVVNESSHLVFSKKLIVLD